MSFDNSDSISAKKRQCCHRENHETKDRKVLQQFKDANVKNDTFEAEFFQHVLFLGHNGSRGGNQVDRAKISAVRQSPVPKSVTEVKGFSGLCSFNRWYVRDFSAIARPLQQLTTKTKDFH